MEFQTQLNRTGFWTKYNKSQTKEKILFVNLLQELCCLLPRKYKSRGSKPLELSHIIFCICMKNYCIKSSRRVIGELELCKNAGFIEKVPHFNSLLNYLRNPCLTPILQELIKLTSLPLTAVEKKFCCDSTGFGNSILDDRWSKIRQQYSKHHRYYKAHITFGVLTNIVTSARITEGNKADSPMLPEMVEETSENFTLKEFSGDKAYSSRDNLNKIWEKGALPLIPFKSNATQKKRGSGIWKEMYNFFEKNNALFMKKYHLRSNAESGMFMIKQRFGDLTCMRNETGSKNDVLCKILCHNLIVLVQEIFLLNLDINFAQFRRQLAQCKI